MQNHIGGYILRQQTAWKTKKCAPKSRDDELLLVHSLGLVVFAKIGNTRTAKKSGQIIINPPIIYILASLPSEHEFGKAVTRVHYTSFLRLLPLHYILTRQ